MILVTSLGVAVPASCRAESMSECEGVYAEMTRWDRPPTGSYMYNRVIRM